MTAAEPTAAGRRWATIDEACRYARLSRRTYYRLRAEQPIDAYRPRGGKVLVDLDSLDAALRRRPA